MKHFVFFLVLVLLSTTVLAQGSFDWPQWQGPDRNAISKERGLLQEWPEKGPPPAQKPWIVSIPGTTNPEHLAENLGAAVVKFAPDEFKQICADLSELKVQGVRSPESALIDQ